MKPQVLIIMGSDSDLPVADEAGKTLAEFGIPYDMTIASAHRTPDRAIGFAAGAERQGVEAIIAVAGAAAHLAGVVAAHTIVPVIGVPVNSSPLQGLDALLSTVQMPPGIPVATMAVGKAGARNAAILAAQIIGRKDRDLAKRLHAFRRRMTAEVERKAEALRKGRQQG